MLRWRQFSLAAAGLFGFSGGSEWDTGHYRMKVVVRGVRGPFFLQRTSGVAAVTPAGGIALAASCGSMVTHQWNRRVNSMPDPAQPRFRPLCGPSLGWGHKLGMQMYSIDCARNAKSSHV